VPKNSNRLKRDPQRTLDVDSASEHGCRYGLQYLEQATSEGELDGRLGAKAHHIRRSTASRRDFLFCTCRR
jgi:hypothetical protein